VLSALETGATVFMGVPTMYSRLVSHLEAQGGAAEAMRTARLFTSGSAALPAPLHARFYELTGHAILERYGMSETGFTLSNPYEGHRQPGTVGFPVKGYEIKILADDGALCAVDEQGELWVRGDGLMEGYWGQPKATAAVMDDGWFRTGDVVVRQRDGYLRIQGRASADIIKSGGFKISALEIEAVLLQHPEVGEAAVVGLPDSEWGESIAAAIVPRTPDGVLDTAALSSFVADRIATYKQPRFIWVTDVLPRNALGKLQKHLLRPMLIAAQD
jgi:acyl-CoA synthetase (AMP-forming)/AMP-acid ligase II